VETTDQRARDDVMSISTVKKTLGAQIALKLLDEDAILGQEVLEGMKAFSVSSQAVPKDISEYHSIDEYLIQFRQEDVGHR
jgi:hypothetical protein